MEQQNGETEFKATGITQQFRQVWTIDEEKMAGLHTPEQMYEKFVEFYNRVRETYGKVTHVFADYGALRTSLDLWYEQIFTTTQCTNKS